MLPLLEEAYVKTGKLLIVYKEYPVIGGDAAVMASFASQCAAVQGQFQVYHDWLFANVGQWRGGDTLAQLKEGAAGLGLDSDAFNACLDNQETRDMVVTDYQEGRDYGIRGTPNFVINGHQINGLLSYEQFVPIIDALLAEAESGQLPEFVATVTPTPTPDTNFTMNEVTSKGDPEAPVVLVEFSDFQCPYCQRYTSQTYAKIIENYVDTGKVRYVFKQFPLISIHPQAMAAANAALCAADQGAFWQMHDLLFEQQNRWAGNSAANDVFKEFAAQLGLDADAFGACLENQQHEDDIYADLQEGINAGVTGTPGFFINGVPLSGAQPYEAFQKLIEQQLK